MSRTDPVSQRHNMTEAHFNNLSTTDQNRVVKAKMADQAIKPMLAAAAKQVASNAQKMNDALKGSNK